MKVITKNTVLDNEEVACDEKYRHMSFGEIAVVTGRNHVCSRSSVPPPGDVVDIKMPAMWNANLTYIHNLYRALALLTWAKAFNC